MNLVDDPWIPCIRRDGMVRPASLRDCFTCDDIVDLAVRPHERVALMRLLLCVSYAAAGIPEDYDGWEDLRERLPLEVPVYLDQWRDAFELFHPEKPFLQIAELRSGSKFEECIPCSKLDFALASGNNSTIFDHAALSERQFSPAWLALKLLGFQMFSPSGTIGAVYWGDAEIAKETGYSAICMKSSMLHTSLRGQNIFETIHMNILSKEKLDSYFIKNNLFGRPLWEMFPQTYNDHDAISNATQTFIGRLVPLTRLIRLKKNCKHMILGNGLDFPSFGDAHAPFPQEISATAVLNNKKDALVLLKYIPDIAIWRQLASITVYPHKDSLSGCRIISNGDSYETIDIVVDGIMYSGNGGFVDATESTFHIPGEMFQTEGHSLYEGEVARAENIALGLGNAVERYRRLVDGGWEGRLKQAGPKKGEELARLKAQALRHYWTAVEKNLSLLWRMVRTCGSEAFPPVRQAWLAHLEKSARAAYAAACGKDTERQMRAYVTGRRILAGCLRKYLEHDGKKEEA